MKLRRIMQIYVGSVETAMKRKSVEKLVISMA